MPADATRTHALSNSADNVMRRAFMGHMAIEAALAGQGVVLGLRPLIDDDLRARRLVRLFHIELRSPFSFWFMCRRQRVKDPKIARFLEWLQAQLRLSDTPAS